MDLLKCMRSFVAVAELGSFSRAARQSNVSAAAVTRDVAALESHLGAKLFQRTTRRVHTTNEGVVFLSHAKRILADLQSAEATLRGAHGDLIGTVSITAPSTFGRLHVTPALLKFAAHNPKIVVRTLFVDRIVDLVEEQVDVAVRIARLPDSGASAVRVGTVRRLFLAAPAYLERYGAPSSLEDLASHFAVVTTNLPPPWRVSVGSRSKAVVPKVRMVANTVELAVAAAEAGLGIAWLLSYQVESALAEGRLLPILTQQRALEVPVHVVHLLGKAAPRRTRVLVDSLVGELRSGLARTTSPRVRRA